MMRFYMIICIQIVKKFSGGGGGYDFTNHAAILIYISALKFMFKCLSQFIECMPL